MPEMMVWRGEELSIRGVEVEEPMLERSERGWVNGIDAVAKSRKLRERRRKLRSE